MTVGLLQFRGGDAPGVLFNLTTEDGLSNLTTEDGLSVLQTSNPGGPLDFPGIGNNLVGFDNTPANVGGAGNPAWPGAFQNGSATFMGGIYAGLSNPCNFGDGTGGTLHLVSGTTYYYLDISPGAFDAGLVPNATGVVGGLAVTGVTFIGCRFTGAGQSVASIACVNQYTTGSGLLFKYCTFAPTRVSMFPALAAPNPIPARAWPSTSVGQGFKVNDSVYQTPWLSACRDCINIAVSPGTLVRLEHCDMWGTSAFIGVSGQNWQRGVRSATVNGTIEIVDCWMHDNLLPAAPTWNSSTNYPIGSYAAGTDFNNYKATAASGPANGGAQGPPDTNPGGKWIFWSTFAHSNGVMPTNVNGMSNILVEHCTISGLGNTVGCNAGHNWTIGTFWNASTPYTTGQEALSVDGYHYVAARANTGVDPSGDIHTLDWTQDGFNHDDNVVFRRNFISGVWFSATVDLGYGNSNSRGIVFEDNILSNAVMWNHLCYSSNPLSNGGPYTPDQTGIFPGNSVNSWRRNTYSVWPGSAAWDAANATKDGQYVWPDGTINPRDWSEFPGLPSNPVGYAGTPAAVPATWQGGTWPGRYVSLTPSSWPPTATSGPAWGSGTPGNPTIVAFKDFSSPGFYPVSITGADSAGPVNNVTFVGCRWQSNDVNTHYVLECFKSGSSGILFSYCSVTPLVSLWPSPKGFTRWPSAGALTGVATDGTPATAAARDPYTIPYNDGYLFGMALAANAGGVVTADHCDVWGSGFGITTANTGVGQVIISDNWVHDCRNDANDADHTDGIGNASGNFVDSNVIVRHNTICSIGTTRGGSWQRAANLWVSGTSYGQFNYATDPTNHLAYFALNNISNSTVQPHSDPTNWQQNGQGYYSNYQVTNNYFSGWNGTIDAFGRQAGVAPFGTGLVFTDNIFATDLSCGAIPLYEDQQTQFNIANFNSTWRRNRLMVVPGDNWSSTYLDGASPTPQPLSKFQGQFLLPVRNATNTWATMFSTTDWAS